MEKPQSSSSSTLCSLEVTIISAEDLRMNRRLIKKNAFITLETDFNNSHSTTIDTDGGSSPSWNQKLELPLPYNLRYIRLDAKCKTSSGARIIGSVSIPISDFLEDFFPPNRLHFLSYRLRERDGDRNGIVNLAVRVNGVPPCSLPAPVRVQCGYKNSNACRSMPRPSYRSSGGMAIGIPISKGYGI